MWDVWLLLESVRIAFEKAFASGNAPTAQQQIEFEASLYGEDEPLGSRILSVVGDAAEIAITGVLTETPSFMARYYGGGNTTYPEILAAVKSAMDEGVKDIDFNIKSPGGSLSGLFELLEGLDKLNAPIRNAKVNGLLASAAYPIAAKAQKIVATSRGTRIGSLGIMYQAYIDENNVMVRSTNAPKKNPDASTEAGKVDIVEELDGMEALFFEHIATAKGITVDKIKADFGQGAVFLADEALKRGMIDEIENGSAASNSNGTPQPTTAKKSGVQEDSNMDLGKLKAEHPALYAAVKAEGAIEGAATEKDRVSAHLIMGKASGAMETAIKAVQDGSGMTATLNAEYMAASMNGGDVADRDADALAAKAAADAKILAEKGDGGDSEGVLAILEANAGIGSEV